FLNSHQDDCLAPFLFGDSSSRIRFGELTLNPYGLDARSAKFEMTMYLARGGGAIAGALEYRSDLFSRGFVERLAAQYAQLLTEIVTGAEKRVRELEVLPARQREAILAMSEGGKLGKGGGKEGFVERLSEVAARKRD